MSESTGSTEKALTRGTKAALTAQYSDQRKAQFLDTFREICNMSQAAEVAGIDRTTVYNWRRDDPNFKKQFEQAREDGAEALEDVAYQRAQEQSDRLIMALLKAYKPDRFGDRLDITSGGQPIDLSWPEHKDDEE